MDINIPQGFTYLNDSRILYSMDYVGHDNFMGQPLEGYHDRCCILTRQTAQALLDVQDTLDKMGRGLKLKIFDAYRPQQAVDHIARWAKLEHDNAMQTRFYPNHKKLDLLGKGYLASKRSSHTRGSTVDLTLVQVKQGDSVELDMGTCFDFFDDASHLSYKHLTKQQRRHRAFLQSLMRDHQFLPFEMEWWHFTLAQEPFLDQYFDFPVKKHF